MADFLLDCPFCGGRPSQGPTKLEYCQLHGDPFQRYRIWCRKGCADLTGADMGHKWRVQHAACAIECRGVRDPERLAYQMAKWERAGRGTGKSAQQARRRLRAALAEKEAAQ